MFNKLHTKTVKSNTPFWEVCNKIEYLGHIADELTCGMAWHSWRPVYISEEFSTFIVDINDSALKCRMRIDISPGDLTVRVEELEGELANDYYIKLQEYFKSKINQTVRLI